MGTGVRKSGDPKAMLRRQVWNELRAAGVARFPGARGRIPNFTGSERAAEILASTPEWQAARVLKCNPDSPQRAVRRAALEAGKRLYVPVPRLAAERPFLLLDPAEIDPGRYWEASSIKGAAELGRPVAIEEMERLDLIVTGCVAVTRNGGRLGKGGGYSDLEYAMLRELELAGEDTPVATTVHSIQVVPSDALPMTAHDLSLDLLITERGVIRCTDRRPRPHGVLWDHLEPARRDAIPVLAARARRLGKE